MMSDSAAFVLTIALVAIGGLLYTAICKLAEAISKKDIVQINNFGATKTDLNDDNPVVGVKLNLDGSWSEVRKND